EALVRMGVDIGHRRDGRIAWVGRCSDAPSGDSFDCQGRLVTPGLIDCHTHLVYGGNRANEFERRLTGVPYAEIARQGGGILATVRATRAADEETLLRNALPRLDTLLSEGVTTIEIKSGYGLDIDTEAKMLRVARALGETRPVTVKTSFLGAHALPQELKDNREQYLNMVCNQALPQAFSAGLVDAVDAFCEGIAFSVEEVQRVFEVARALGLPVKLHAEQLSNLGGARMAASFGALSVDHIEYLDEQGVAAIAASGTVAVLLPGAFYYLREKQAPPVTALRSKNVPMAIATDLNPGSSPVHSLLTAMNMACVLFGLTPEEALMGVTAHAARALGLNDRGRIAAGQRADLALWEAERPGDLAYPLGFNPLAAVIRNGNLVQGSLT
ncbi:MAG: imidazolonepropionase, partial [Halioglobus sp.]|nr:imidazolonepropionase [Halioglobus sp.]